MPYANSHVKITIFGDMFGGAEEWSTGFRMGQEDVGGGNFAIGAGFLDALLPLWQTAFTGAGGSFSTQYRTIGIKASVILASGATDPAVTDIKLYPTPIAGTNGAAQQAPQVSLVAQLATAVPRGLGSKGRMYLPGVNYAVGNNGQIGATEATAVATKIRDFLDAAEVAVNSPGYVIIASKGRVAPVPPATGQPAAPPVHRRVTAVRVGTVYDTQRRRRNGLAETYYSRDLNGVP